MAPGTEVAVQRCEAARVPTSGATADHQEVAEDGEASRTAEKADQEEPRERHHAHVPADTRAEPTTSWCDHLPNVRPKATESHATPRGSPRQRHDADEASWARPDGSRDSTIREEPWRVTLPSQELADGKLRGSPRLDIPNVVPLPRIQRRGSQADLGEPCWGSGWCPPEPRPARPRPRSPGRLVGVKTRSPVIFPARRRSSAADSTPSSRAEGPVISTRESSAFIDTLALDLAPRTPMSAGGHGQSTTGRPPRRSRGPAGAGQAVRWIEPPATTTRPPR